MFFDYKNEHIYIMVIYYYDNFNITESHLSFYQVSSAEGAYKINYEQDYYNWLPAIFEKMFLQYIGDIIVKEGHLVTFLNTYQNWVGIFELLDKTKSGHKKILALFLLVQLMLWLLIGINHQSESGTNKEILSFIKMENI